MKGKVVVEKVDDAKLQARPMAAGAESNSTRYSKKRKFLVKL
jgi:hypothetical protein